MRLVHKFHNMEREEKLFELGKDIGFPAWDIIRYKAFRNINYPKKSLERLKANRSRNICDYLIVVKEILKFFFYLPFVKTDVVIFTDSRYINKQSQHFDKSAMPIMSNLDKSFFIIESVPGRKTIYRSFYDITSFFGYFVRKRNKPISVFYDIMNEALIKNFGHSPISKSEFLTTIKVYESRLKFYRFLYKFKKPESVIICTGNPKASIKIAKERAIKTYLVQHAGIEIDEIDYSYPTNIDKDSNILFPDYVLTFGKYWCTNMNVPAKKIIPLGNDLFFKSPVNTEPDNSVLFVSTIIHGLELSKVALELSHLYPAQKIVFKLHPNEFHLAQNYHELFFGRPNIHVVLNEVETSVLIAKSLLVVLIVSAVLYEALQHGKKVAVLERINYERQLYLSFKEQLFFFSNTKDLKELLKMQPKQEPIVFYEKTNLQLLKDVFSDKPNY